jgi:hypothetical protein
MDHARLDRVRESASGSCFWIVGDPNPPLFSGLFRASSSKKPVFQPKNDDFRVFFVALCVEAVTMATNHAAFCRM